jgi:hypothetical protein
MKSVVMVLCMGLCITSGALYAAPPMATGIIQFSGVIAKYTCANAVLPPLGPGVVQNRKGCGDMATDRGHVGSGPAYAESMTIIAGRSGVDVLDYYVDNLHALSVASVQLLTRDYD